MTALVQAPLLAAAASEPSWLWYATRGLGAATLIVLTLTVVLGIVTATRWFGRWTPAFVTADLHRNLSLLGLALVIAHVVTTVLDPFAHISVRDVIVPFGASYRPVWLGLGVVAAEIMVAVIVTSLLRDRVGPVAWRLIHWAAYGSWPLAVVHGLGTGSDARAPWLIWVTVSCVAAVALAILSRIREGQTASLPIRIAAGVAMVAFLVVATQWAFGGPWQPDWSSRSGTPILKTAATAGRGHTGPFSDPLIGVVVHDAAGNVQVSLRDTVDTALTILVRSPDANETLPVVTITRGSRVLCVVPATSGTSLYAVCNSTRLTITFYGSPALLKTNGSITGRIDTTGPLD